MVSDTTRVKLLCQETDTLDYTTYVFEVLDIDEINRLGYKYIMCTRWPNWNHRELSNGEEGYLHYFIILAGVDKWFDGKEFIPYKCSTYQFDKFISKQPKFTNKNFKL